MSVVKEWTTEGGTTIRIHDDAYIGISPEEMQKRKDNIKQVVAILLKEMGYSVTVDWNLSDGQFKI